MKARPLIVLLLLMHGFACQAAIVTVVEPPEEGLRLGAAAGVDLNNDGTTDLWIHYYDMPLCIGSPEGTSSVCSLGITIAFASHVSLLADPRTLDPVALLPGQSIGPTPPVGEWLSPVGSPILLIHRSGAAPLYPDGFPDYTDDLRRLAIGFRLTEQQSESYGYLDVSLWRPWFVDPAYETPGPRVEGIFLADSPNASVTVTHVPEPSAGLLLIVGTFLGGSLLRNRGQ